MNGEMQVFKNKNMPEIRNSGTQKFFLSSDLYQLELMAQFLTHSGSNEPKNLSSGCLPGFSIIVVDQLIESSL